MAQQGLVRKVEIHGVLVTRPGGAEPEIEDVDATRGHRHSGAGLAKARVQQMVQDLRKRILRRDEAVLREGVAEDSHVDAFAQITVAEIPVLPAAETVVHQQMSLVRVRAAPSALPRPTVVAKGGATFGRGCRCTHGKGRGSAGDMRVARMHETQRNFASRQSRGHGEDHQQRRREPMGAGTSQGLLPTHYQVSTLRRFFSPRRRPGVAAGPAASKAAVIQRRESAGSITSSTAKDMPAFSALPRS